MGIVCPSPPAPMNHVKIFKGWPPRDAPSKLVQLGYKTLVQNMMCTVCHSVCKCVCERERLCVFV